MKKIILSMLLVLSVALVFAQKANVSKAKNKALMVESPDFSGARELIKPALEEATTKDLASTWYVAGLIGYKESEALMAKAMLGQTIDADVKGKALMESYAYFLKANDLDQLPDEKGKIKPKHKDIKAKIKEYYTVQQNLVAYGAYLFEKKKYDETINVFETFLSIPKLPMMNNEIKEDSTYYMIKYYTAIAATNANKNDKAITLYKELIGKNYEELNVHQLLYEEYTKKKDTVNFVSVLKMGFEKFPAEAWFLQNLINYYIFTNQLKDAMVYLNSAIEKEPKLAQYRYVKGNLDETLGNFDDAQVSFEKAIELDPKFADAYAGIGRLFYNKAVKIFEDANDIKDLKLANAAKKKSDEVFAQSIPYFKKAIEANPTETEYKRTLKTLYYRLKMDKEFEAIEKELNK